MHLYKGKYKEPIYVNKIAYKSFWTVMMSIIGGYRFLTIIAPVHRHGTFALYVNA